MGQQQNSPQFGDTTLTKVFVGGLAWETQKETLRCHFDQYGDILEAVIISDKLTGRSKGYGFVTFKDSESAEKACQDSSPVINGRQANCNLASLGARRNKVPTAVAGGLTVKRAAPVPSSWYYAGAVTRQFYQQYHGAVPFYATPGAYGYSPNYATAADLNYSSKVSNPGGGAYAPSQFYHGGMLSPSAMMPIYPMYHHHHQSQSMGFPAANFFSPVTSCVVTAKPAIITKPNIVTPTTVCLAVE